MKSVFFWTNYKEDYFPPWHKQNYLLKMLNVKSRRSDELRRPVYGFYKKCIKDALFSAADLKSQQVYICKQHS